MLKPETASLRLRRALPWILALALAALPMLVTLVVPPGRDQGLFCYYGWRLLEGDAPYVQVWDHKPPAIHATYALALAVGGLHYAAVMVLALLARLATAWLLGRLLARLTGGRHAPVWLAAFAGLALLPWDGRFWSLAQPEAFMNLGIALSLLLALGRRPYLGGAALVTACWFKPVAILWAPLLLLSGAGFFQPGGRDGDRRRLLVASAWRMLVGAVVGSLPWIVWLVARGALGEFRQAVVDFNSFHAAGGVFVDRGLRIGKFCREIWLPGLLAVAVPAVLRIRSRAGDAGRAAVFFAGWLAAALAAVGVQRKFFDYHLILLVPPVAALAVVSAARIWHGALAARPRLVKVGVVAAALALAVAWYVPLWNSQLSLPARRLLGRIPAADFENAYREARDFSYPADRDFAAWLDRTTHPGDPVQVMGFEPLVNFLARRRAASRFCFDYPYTFTPGSRAAESWREQARRRLRNDLTERPPTIIALMRNDANAIEPEATARQMEDIPWFRDLITASYEPVGVKEDFIVFRRRPAGSPQKPR